MFRKFFIFDYLSEQKSAEKEKVLINVQIETIKKLVNKTQNPSS